jgi:hypothetical protein
MGFTKSYFSLSEWLIIIILALISTLINTSLPIKAIMKYLDIPGPAAGMALLGGFIFVLWVFLAVLVIKKKYSGVITSILIASFCLFIHPWYGIVSPAWFSIYALVSLFCLGSIIEFLESKSYGVVGGGLGNLCCLLMTWLAIGVHTGTWVSLDAALFLCLAAFVSGSIGAGLAYGINNLVRSCHIPR